MNEKKKERVGLELILLLILAAAGIFWQQLSGGAEGREAVVTYDGEPVLTIPLDRPGFYQLKEDPSVQFEVREGAVAFVNASCPDKICEREGFLSKAGQTAVCLPRKTVLRIVGGDGEIDLTAG